MLNSRELKFKAKEAEILQIKLDFIRLYPKIPVYLKYDEPYYKIRVGDCRTKLQAIKIQHLINYLSMIPHNLKES
mgnify:CR=1 FL=1